MANKKNNNNRPGGKHPNSPRYSDRYGPGHVNPYLGGQAGQSQFIRDMEERQESARMQFEQEQAERKKAENTAVNEPAQPANQQDGALRQRRQDAAQLAVQMQNARMETQRRWDEAARAAENQQRSRTNAGTARRRARGDAGPNRSVNDPALKERLRQIQEQALMEAKEFVRRESNDPEKMDSIKPTSDVRMRLSKDNRPLIAIESTDSDGRAKLKWVPVVLSDEEMEAFFPAHAAANAQKTEKAADEPESVDTVESEQPKEAAEDTPADDQAPETPEPDADDLVLIPIAGIDESAKPDATETAANVVELLSDDSDEEESDESAGEETDDESRPVDVDGVPVIPVIASDSDEESEDEADEENEAAESDDEPESDSPNESTEEQEESFEDTDGQETEDGDASEESEIEEDTDDPDSEGDEPLKEIDEETGDTEDEDQSDDEEAEDTAEESEEEPVAEEADAEEVTEEAAEESEAGEESEEETEEPDENEDVPTISYDDTEDEEFPDEDADDESNDEDFDDESDEEEADDEPDTSDDETEDEEQPVDEDRRRTVAARMSFEELESSDRYTQSRYTDEDEEQDDTLFRRREKPETTALFVLPKGMSLPKYIDDDDFVEHWLDEEEEDMATVKKRRRRRIAAFVGAATMVLALIGFIAVAKWGLGLLGNIGSSESQKDVYAEYISPVVMSEVPVFEAWDAIPQEKLLQSAVFSVLMDTEVTYERDDTGNFIIPSTDIVNEVKEIYGAYGDDDAQEEEINNKIRSFLYGSVSEDTDTANADVYYVDMEDSFHVADALSGPVPQVTQIAKRDNTITLDVEYHEDLETGTGAILYSRQFILTLTEEGKYIQAIRELDEDK